MSILTVNSISGGKTSCYMALKFEADVNIFSCVLTKDPSCRIKDKGLLRDIQNKLPQFEGSRELDQTLINMLKLEQMLGREIKWLTSEYTYDEMLSKNKFLPNKFNRSCTFELKLFPILSYTWINYGLVIMNIGFRLDEINRAERMMSDCDKAYKTKIPVSCSIKSKRKSHKNIEWRLPYFPLIENGVNHFDVIKYWDDKGWKFPSISNCDFCFFHTKKQLSEQRDLFPERYSWWENKEKQFNHTFGTKPINEITRYSQPSLFDFKDDFIVCSCTD